MNKDLKMLIIFLFGIGGFLAVAFHFGNQNNYTQEITIEKESGEGPWVLPSSNNSSKKFKVNENIVLNNYDEEKIDLKKTTSSHKINFSTLNSDINGVLYDSPPAPEGIKY
jgi:hypothetical protein